MDSIKNQKTKIKNHSMNRREFTKAIGMTAVSLGVAPAIFSQRKVSPQISITMDDFNWANPVKLTSSERNDAILNTLNTHKLKAALFVIGRNIDSDEGRQLLRPWDNAGHLLANHTYSHRSFNAPNVNVNEYQNDILKAEALLSSFSNFRKYLRFPMLKEGATAATRD